MHVPVLRALEDVRLEAVCDPDPARLETFAEKHGVPRSFQDLESFVEENADLDLVLVATPGYTHYEVVQPLLRAGINIFVEKPLALTYAHALEIQRLAHERQAKVCVGHTWRFRDAVVRARQAVDQGLVGTIYQANVVHHGGSLFHAAMPPWAWNEKESRAVLYEHCFHLLDLQVHFAGPVREIVSVKVIDDAATQVTARVYALIVHEGGATSIVDLQHFASTKFTRFELFGTANDIEIKFFPESYRLYSGSLNPIDELVGEVARIWGFLHPILRERVRRSVVPRRCRPHHRVLRQFVEALQDDSTRVPVTIEDVLPTIPRSPERSRVPR